MKYNDTINFEERIDRDGFLCFNLKIFSFWKTWRWWKGFHVDWSEAKSSGSSRYLKAVQNLKATLSDKKITKKVSKIVIISTLRKS